MNESVNKLSMNQSFNKLSMIQSVNKLSMNQLVNKLSMNQSVNKLSMNESCVDGLCEDDMVVLHSCRQWTTVTALSLEEGHYVIGPKIDIPLQYQGRFRLIDEDRDVRDPIQYFSSVEEVAGMFPDRVFAMETISFTVKVRGEGFSEDSESYSVVLQPGDELSLTGKAEFLTATPTTEKTGLSALLRRLGKTPRSKTPCLVCMNHRTNQSISLPFACRGRFCTRSPLEQGMLGADHTVRSIIERVRLPVNVTVPTRPPRNPYDRHVVREGHRYKLLNIVSKTVVLCLVLRPIQLVPSHFLLLRCMPRFSVATPSATTDSLLLRQHANFDPDGYSRAVRETRPELSEERVCVSEDGVCVSPRRGGVCVSAQDSQLLSVCVFAGGGVTDNISQSQRCRDSLGEGTEYLSPNWTEAELQTSEEIPYEELWTNQTAEGLGKAEPNRISVHSSSSLDGLLGTARLAMVTRVSTPPPVPPKSDAVREECRFLIAPPVPPRCCKGDSSPSCPSPTPSPPVPPRFPQTHLSYYSSGPPNRYTHTHTHTPHAHTLTISLSLILTSLSLSIFPFFSLYPSPCPSPEPIPANQTAELSRGAEGGGTCEGSTPPSDPAWRPPTDLSALSLEEVSASLRFIGLSEAAVGVFQRERVDGSLLVQLDEETLSHDFHLSRLHVTKITQFIQGWRPKI
uniref:CABIT domain-containing protein n=1 Tax=Oncorhynchus tshawytscha TaxID=74940 RepID=A0AAZ3RZY3_ONCTS